MSSEVRPISSNGRVRHPEKVLKPDSPIQPKPPWIRVTAPTSAGFNETRNLIHKLDLNTVCEEAACPNIGECWASKHATIMIMGDICTRACAFCNIATGIPLELNKLEPENVAIAVSKLGLAHVVITSVDRDDLDDGGAHHFAEVIDRVREFSPTTTIEVLTPDFQNKEGAIEVVLSAGPDVFNHNLETVPRLYPTVRAGARYFQSLRLLDDVKRLDPEIFSKSGLMVGLGEGKEEVLQVMDDLRAASVDFLTIGQYLQPTVKHHPIARFVPPEEFESYKRSAYGKGFLMVAASPLTRSSYHADRDFEKMKAARCKVTR